MRSVAFAGLSLLASPAGAEVVSSNPNGLHIRHEARLAAPQDRAFSAFGEIGGWWDDEHTYSGDGSNMSLSVAPGGCFCERVPITGGGIEHMRVTYVDPGKRLVLTGPLGPLLFEATAAVMDVKFEPEAEGSRVTMDFRAAGFAAGGADAMAPLIDNVLGKQLELFREFAGSRPPER